MLTELFNRLSFFLLSNYMVIVMTICLLSGRSRTPKGIAAMVCEGIIMCAAVTAFRSAVSYLPATIYFCWAVSWLYIAFLSNKPLHAKITTACIVSVAPHFIGHIVGILTAVISRRYAVDYHALVYLSDLIEVVFCAFTAFFLKRFSSNSAENVPWPYLVIVIVTAAAGHVLTNLGSALMSFTGIENGLSVIPIFAAVFYFFCLTVYYLFYVLSASYAKNQEILLLQQKEAEALASVRRMNLIYDEMRVLRHEYKNELLTMKVMLNDRQYDKLEGYLNNYLNTDAAVLNTIDCGNSLLNNILNLKLNTCRALGIDFDALTNVPPVLPFEEGDITSLLVNLIDNAIEAAVRSKEPKISVKIRVEKKYCFIAVFNTVFGDVMRDNGELATTKKDKSVHGIGLRVVKSIVKKYGGHIRFEQEENIFKVSLMLEINM